ncbi:MAG: ABC transporter permease [Nesterenkonia sp.]|uniref:ABC transporter permease n=1 Tax=Nesterenkonia marinintestina TaxID=2979865 RepID=UPI0021BE910A|nr:ABC transporter permease [Nesterenkonia sp. GX14115]MDO5492191.1 ABC transporter permease [Nesterenkonia sp.]
MIRFIDERWADILFRSYQHGSLVIQSLILATLIGVGIAVLVTTYRGLSPAANAISAVGLTIPSFALLGLLLPFTGIGVVPSVIAVTFYAVLPILRNAVVGLQSVDGGIIESARGQGMNAMTIFWRVRLPLAWPVIMTGIRVSAQMSMGVAAIAAYVLGPGLGPYIFTGLSTVGGANALNYAVVGTVGIIVVALLLDALLVLFARLTTSKGIRA